MYILENLSTWETEADRLLSWRPAQFTQVVPGSQVQGENMSQKQKEKNKKEH